jgi:cyclopropane-fatty-acyl-phospholipid synthase
MDREVAGNNKGASAEAIQYHYDVGNGFYSTWLDKSMTYSAALWPDVDFANFTLEDAQAAKLDWHINGLGLNAGDRLLDVGCGWGSLMHRAITSRDLSAAIGLTLSKEQASWIAANIGDAPITVRICPWQEYADEKPFDAIVSIGAMEHFARPEMDRTKKVACYSEFFEFCSKNLRNDGRLSLQSITWMNIRPEQERESLPDHIFPESTLPHLAEITAAAEPWFHVIEMHNRPKDYSRTLRKWVENIRLHRDKLSDLHGAETVERYINGWGVFIIAFQRELLGLSRFRLVKRASKYLLDSRPS